jgi:hypothetical protein
LLTCEVHPGLAPEWPALAAGAPMLASPGWLSAMEGRLGPRPVTLLVRDGGTPVAAAYASVQEVPRPGEFYDLHHLLVAEAPALPIAADSRAERAALAGTAPGPAEWLPALVVMLPGYECVPVGPAATDPAALAALVAGARDWALTQRLPTVAFLYTRPDAVALAAALAGHDFTAVPLSLHWELTLPGTRPADHLAALPRKRRKEARRELRELADAGVALRPGDADAEFEDLVRLRGQLVGKYRGTPGDQHTRLRRLIEEVAGGRPHLVVADAGGTAVGFAMFAEHPEDGVPVWHCISVGYDYTDPRSRLAYFGTAYYAAAALAYEAGVHRIGYGQGSWQAKRARGCRPTPLTGWVHSTDPRLADAVRASAAATRLVHAVDGI